jgi:NLR family CARD domain-containing protein 3
MLHCV